ncbi:BadF/BadG/BcrA/BcrD ATPase family protein [Actinoplanes sp. NPDC051513]|uniref:BadF/BadG/BcrA/BcrD ATPase family protein n=1 Tax=Actinoplanes sp. NPDC051513 TaxID=3363908 RepID=UPI00379C4040
MSRAYLAVDAGNSKTVALVTDAEGAVLGRGRGGNGDIYGAASIPDALEAVFGAVGLALAGAGITPGDVASAAFRIAGVDYPEDAEFWDGHVHERLGGLGRWSVKNDAYASLRLIDGSGVAASITVGTGPAVAARAKDGREEHSGFFVFDHLGGSGLGDAALRAVCRAWMGIGPETALTSSMCSFYGVADGWELRHAFTRRFGARPASDLWQASRLVLVAAGAGDAVARDIVAAQAEAFVKYAQWCSRRAGVELASGELPVLLNGSVATSEHPAMRDALTLALGRVAPAARVVVADASPLSGVVLDALAEGGVAVGPDLLARVRDNHPHDFLTTF